MYVLGHCASFVPILLNILWTSFGYPMDIPCISWTSLGIFHIYVLSDILGHPFISWTSHGHPSGGRAARHANNIKHRASAAVVSGLERRLQEVREGMMGAGSGGINRFERGEGGGVT